MAIAPKRFGDGILLRHCVTIKWRLLALWRNPRSDAPYCQQLPFLGAQDYKRWQHCLACEPFIAHNVSAAAARRTFEKEHGRRVDGSTLLLAVSFNSE